MLKRIKNRKNWMPPKIENKVVPATGNRRFFLQISKNKKTIVGKICSMLKFIR